MAQIKDFDVDKILELLNPISLSQPEGSKERDAIELAQIALIYPRHIKREDDFRKYYSDIFDPSFKFEISHDFETREDADKWLASGKAEDAERVKIAGKGFMVVYVSGRPRLMVAPLPEELETDEWKEDSD